MPLGLENPSRTLDHPATGLSVRRLDNGSPAAEFYVQANRDRNQLFLNEPSLTQTLPVMSYPI